MRVIPTMLSWVLLFSAVGCDGDETGADAGGEIDGGEIDGGEIDAGGRADAGGEVDATSPGGSFAEISISGAHTGMFLWRPPSALILCEDEPALGGVFVRAAASSAGGPPPGESAEHVDIDLFGPIITGDYTAIADPGDSGPQTFDVFYHPSASTIYGNAATSSPCALSVAEADTGILDLTFTCASLVRQFPAGPETVDVSGRIRCER